MKAGFVSICACLWFGVLSAQPDLYTALGKGDIPGIAKYFGDNLEVSIENKEAILTRQEAENRLKEFYARNIPTGYKAVHAGTSKTHESTYSIGELATDKGVFRVYLYFTQEGEKRMIAELRLER